MTQQVAEVGNTSLVYCICISASSSQTAPMINYFEFQVPDNDRPHDYFQSLHSPPSPQYPLHHLLPEPLEICHNGHPNSPAFFDLAETLESEARAVPPLEPTMESAAEELLMRQCLPQSRVKNETKNIPKNFGKGIISFIEKNEKKVRSLLRQERVTYSCFIEMMREEKKSINTILDLRRLWTHEIYGRCLRIISNLFFRRHALDYIFNSRISNYASHIKYRQTLWKAIRNPEEFNRIKEF